MGHSAERSQTVAGRTECQPVLTANELAGAIGGRLRDADPQLVCPVMATDSRTLEEGDVFWALPGERFDGHDFIDAARARGAALVVVSAAMNSARGWDDLPRIVVENPLAAFGRLARWHRRRLPGLIVGVTGSVGKTTTRELIHAALSGQFHGMRSPGNFNNLVGLPKSLLELRPDHEFAVLELGASQVGDIRQLSAIAEPEVAAITAIGKAHLESFGSVEGIIQGKGELLEALPENGFAVLPGDDPVLRRMASRARCRVLFVGEGPQNDYRATNVIATAERLTIQVAEGAVGSGSDYTVNVPIVGRHNLSNVLIAVAIAREVGVAPAVVAEGLSTFQAVAGRCRVRSLGSWTVIDDCYNASPTAVSAACRLLAHLPICTVDAASDRRSLGHSRRYLVLGDMLELGKASAAEHVEIGRLAARLKLDGVLAFGAEAASVAKGASAGGLPAGRIVATQSLEVLTTILDCWLSPGDAVLVKGSRGMQMERIIGWLETQAAGPANDAANAAVMRSVRPKLSA